MSLFRRRQSDPVPGDVVQILERYGRWAFEPIASGIDTSEIGHERLTEPIIRAFGQGPGAASRAIDALSDTFVDRVLPMGGWAVYGAYKLLIDFRDELSYPPDVRLMEAGLEFLRERGVPWNSHLSPFEKEFWVARHPGGAHEWMPWREPPDHSATPRDLAEGESRHVADVHRPIDNLVNRIHFRRGSERTYVAVVFGEDSDPRQEPTVWFTEPTLYQLCLTVGTALSTPPHWVAEDLRPFIPQPAMDLSQRSQWGTSPP